MAMDSYMKGVAGGSEKQVMLVKPVEKGQKTAVSKSSGAKVSASENVAAKSSTTGDTAKKVSVPKSSIRKAPIKKSSVKKASVPKSRVKKISVSGNSTQKVNKPQVQKVDNAQAVDSMQEMEATGKENMEALFSMGKEPAQSTIDSAISSLNAQMSKTKCSYAYDETTKRITIKVYDEDTEELIREIPPERSLEVLQKVWERAGIMVDEKF